MVLVGDHHTSKSRRHSCSCEPETVTSTRAQARAKRVAMGIARVLHDGVYWLRGVVLASCEAAAQAVSQSWGELGAAGGRQPLCAKALLSLGKLTACYR